MSHDRVMLRHYHRMTHYEAKAGTLDHTKSLVPIDAHESMAFLGLPNQCDEADADTRIIKSLNRGENFEWDAKPKVR